MKALPHSPSLRRLAIPAVCLFGLLALNPFLHATSLYWDANSTTAGAGGTPTGNWGTSNFWNSDSAGLTDTFTATTTSADDLFFSADPGAASGNGAYTVTLGANQAANSLNFQSSGATSIAAGAGPYNITLGAGGIVGTEFAYGSTARGAVTIAPALVLAANQSFVNNGTGLLTVSGAISGTANLVLQNNNATANGLTLSGAVNNSGTISNTGTNAGTGTVTISGTIGSAVTGITQNSSTSALAITGVNTSYAGTTTLTSGTLQARGSLISDLFSPFGSSALMLNGGTLSLRVNGSGSSGKTIVVGATAGVANAIGVTIGSSAVTFDLNNNAGTNGWNTNSVNFGTLSLGSGTVNAVGLNNYSLAFNGVTTLTADATFNPTTANIAMLGVIGGNFGITKTGTATSVVTGTSTGNGTGVLTLSAANTYSGVTTIKEGILSLTVAAPSGANGALGNATSDVLLGDTTGSSDATLRTSVTSGTAIARAVRVQSGNSGTAFLGGSNTAGTSTISSNIILGTNGGTGHGITLLAGSGGITSFTGVIQDPSSLSGAGADVTFGTSNGTVVLAGANTYSGTTIIKAGSLVTSVAAPSGAAGALGNSTKDILLGDTSGSASVVLRSNMSSGTVIARNIRVQSGNTGTASFGSTTSSANVTFSGNIILGTDGGTGHGITLLTTSAGTSTFSGSIQDPASLSGTGGAVTMNNTGGIFVLSGTNTYTGATAITAGTVKAGSTQALGVNSAVTLGGTSAALNLNGFNNSIGSLAGGSATSGNVTLGANTLTTGGDNTSTSYAGVINGTGGFTKTGSGVQTLTNTHTYSGTTAITGGTLALGASGSISSSALITVSSGATLDVSAQSFTLAAGKTLRGAGSVTGAATMASTSTLGGGIDASTLGNLTFSGTLTSASGATFSLKLNSDSALSDAIIAAGITLNGATLALADLGSTTLSGATVFTLLHSTSTSISGTFTGLGEGASITVGANSYTISYAANGGNDVTLTASAIPEPSTYAVLFGALTLTGALCRRRSRIA